MTGIDVSDIARTKELIERLKRYKTRTSGGAALKIALTLQLERDLKVFKARAIAQGCTVESLEMVR